MSNSDLEWKRLTIAELKDELNQRGLLTKGRKSELIARLENFSQEEENKEEQDNSKKPVTEAENSGELTENGANDVVADEETMDTGQDTSQSEGHLPETLEEMQVLDIVGHPEGQEDTDIQDKGQTEEIADQGDAIEFESRSEDHCQQEDKVPADMQELGMDEEEENSKMFEDLQDLQDEMFCSEEELLKDGDEKEKVDEGMINLESSQEEVVCFEEVKENGKGGSAKESDTDDSVIILDDDEDEEQVEQLDASEKTDAKEGESEPSTDKPTNPPMPSVQFKNWIGHQLHMNGRERSLFVNQVRSKEKLCSLLKDWAPTCSEFQLHFNREGHGAALLTFPTVERMQQAKTEISQLIGADNILQMTDLFHLESAVNKALNVNFKSPDPASRSIVVEGIPKLTKEEKILEYFPDAMLLTRPVKKREFKVELLPEVESHCFIEFTNAEAAEEALNCADKITETFHNAVVKSMDQYLEDFKKWEKARSKMISIERDYKSQVISDEDRLQLCGEFQKLNSQLHLQGKRHHGGQMYDHLKTTRAQLLRSLDQDTDMRRMMGESLPEPESLMTAYARGVVKTMQDTMGVTATEPESLVTAYATSAVKTTQENMDVIATDEMEISEDEDEPVAIDINVPVEGSEEAPKEIDMDKLLEGEIAKLHPDEKDNFTLSIKNDGRFTEKIEVLQQFSHFGEVNETRITKRRAFVSFATKEGAETMLANLLGNKEWSIAVPRKPGTQEGGDVQSKRSQASKHKNKGDKDQGNVFFQMFVTGGGGQESDEVAKYRDKMLGDKPVTVNVSNISLDSKVAKLGLLFGKYGRVMSFQMDEPKPNKNTLTASVTFKNAPSAFKALAAKKIMLDGNRLVVSASTTVTSQLNSPAEDPETLLDRQVLVRGLHLTSNENSLRQHFSQFGHISDCQVFRDEQGRSKSYGMVTFRHEHFAKEALKFQSSHIVDRCIVLVAPYKRSKHTETTQKANQKTWQSVQQEAAAVIASKPKPAKTKEEEVDPNVCHRQVFLRQLNLESTRDSLEKYFSSFGAIEKCHVFVGKNRKSRGFALLTFIEEESAKKVLSYQEKRNHIVDMKRISIAPQKGSKFDDEDKSKTQTTSQTSEEKKTSRFGEKRKVSSPSREQKSHGSSSSRRSPQRGSQSDSSNTGYKHRDDSSRHEKKSRLEPETSQSKTRDRHSGHSQQDRYRSHTSQSSHPPRGFTQSVSHPVSHPVMRGRPKTGHSMADGSNHPPHLSQGLQGVDFNQPPPPMGDYQDFRPMGSGRLAGESYLPAHENPLHNQPPVIQTHQDTDLRKQDTDLRLLSLNQEQLQHQQAVTSTHQAVTSTHQAVTSTHQEATKTGLVDVIKDLHQTMSAKIRDMNELHTFQPGPSSRLQDASTKGYSQGSESRRQEEPRENPGKLASRSLSREDYRQIAARSAMDELPRPSLASRHDNRQIDKDIYGQLPSRSMIEDDLPKSTRVESEMERNYLAKEESFLRAYRSMYRDRLALPSELIADDVRRRALLAHEAREKDRIHEAREKDRILESKVSPVAYAGQDRSSLASRYIRDDLQRSLDYGDRRMEDTRNVRSKESSLDHSDRQIDRDHSHLPPRSMTASLPRAQVLPSDHADRPVTRDYMHKESALTQTGKQMDRDYIPRQPREASLSQVNQQVDREHLHLPARSLADDYPRSSLVQVGDRPVNRDYLPREQPVARDGKDPLYLSSRSSLAGIQRPDRPQEREYLSREQPLAQPDRQLARDLRAHLPSRSIAGDPPRESHQSAAAAAHTGRPVDADVIQLLRKQELIRKEAEMQQNTQRLQEQQAIQRQMEEIELQRELVQLQKMKEAALMEAMIARNMQR